MNRAQFLQMQRGFDEVAELELAERRIATPATRMKQLDAIWAMATKTGAIREEDDGGRLAWAKLRQAIHARSRIDSE